jgi:hypothetical protein
MQIPRGPKVPKTVESFIDSVKLTKPSEGWWACQRQMQFSLMCRCQVLSELIHKAVIDGNESKVPLLQLEYEITDKIRRHLKNSLLWDTSRGE